MRARQGWAGLFAFATGFSLAGSSSAQVNKARLDEGIRIDQLQPASPESPFLRALGPHEKGTNTIEFAFGLSFDYGMGLLKAVTIDGQGGETIAATPVQNALLAHVGGSITPLPWLTVDLALPVGLFLNGDLQESLDRYGVIIRQPETLGVGDLRAGLHFRPVDTKAFTFVAGARFWAPVGSTASFLSDKRLRAEVDLGVASEKGSFRWGCTAFVSPLFFIDVAGSDGERIALACAAQLRAASFLWVGLEPSFAMFNQTHASVEEGKDPPSSIDLQIEPLASVRMAFGGMQVGLSGGPGFGGAAGAPGFRGVLSLAYVGGGKPKPMAPKGPSDRDLDKIPDAEDACPDAAGPDNADPKERGCPSSDKDGDGIRDEEDACPQSPGVKHASAEANGCPDVDNDQLPEPVDKCPTEPGPAPEGCPKYARLKGESFEIKPPIKFSTGDQLTPEGQAALEEIAATMRANPKIEQVSVSLGTKGVSADLSDRRAQAIIFVLRSGSLDSNRYELVLRDDLRAGTVQARIIK
ncbi:thrombospondin type 3 repeat-containing protein [Polyangium sorediatum]|uniref:Thrombospondin type 3 repeat-containing protein n=1 Tax=Polyangium sorediatum TaxID=889274 RepID=A0ABT6P3B0_9BACT|nr:thrombospondin type 3 repeat-containing protein [Polyangium sorediatum]MDI1435096.1 thrombospondin type 3 repeat-containing protein [Polyangium sorediatum]